MAQIQKKIQKKTRSKTTCFFGCFGFSGDQVFDQMSPEKVGGYGRRKKSRWFSWSKFRMKRPPSTKTVPVSDKPTQKNHIQSENLTASAASKRKPPSQIPAMNLDQDIIIEEPEQIHTKYGNEQSRHLDSTKDDTCQELERMLPTTRKLPCKKTGQRSHPGSPLQSKFDSGPITAVISHPVRKNRQTRGGNAASAVHPSESTSYKAVGKFDTVAVGMSIIMVTLVVMMLWGRSCAILCTSTWLYFIPRLRTTTTTTTTAAINRVKNQSNSKREVMDSNEYKKKVVMKGFLERNHRSSSNNMMRIL